MVGAVSMAAGSGKTVAAHIDLAADNWFDTSLFTCLVKADGAVHNTVIGYGQRRHTVRLGPGYQILDAGCPVQEAVFGMIM